MASFSPWDTEYYETAGGSVPVAEFVDQLAPQAQAKFIRSLELLEQYGILLREPWVKNIQGIPKLRELRFTSFGEIFLSCFRQEAHLASRIQKEISGNAETGAANCRNSYERLHSPAQR